MNNYQERLYEFITVISNYINIDLPEYWTDFCLGFLCENNGYTELLLYISYDEGKSWKDCYEELFATECEMEGIWQARVECEKMREECIANGNQWNVFSLRVLNDGAFNVDFSYDELPIINEYVKRIWRGKQLKC